MLAAFDYKSFLSVWYWVLTVAVWTQVCHRTLGVPYDLMLRAERLPAAAEAVDALARIGAARLAAIHRALGPWLAGAAGFVIAALGVLGFSSDYEAAKAALLLLLPLSVVSLQSLRLAVWIERKTPSVETLRRALARRRAWNQAIAIAAIMAAAVVAVLHHPQVVLR